MSSIALTLSLTSISALFKPLMESVSIAVIKRKPSASVGNTSATSFKTTCIWNSNILDSLAKPSIDLDIAILAFIAEAFNDLELITLGPKPIAAIPSTVPKNSFSPVSAKPYPAKPPAAIAVLGLALIVLPTASITPGSLGVSGSSSIGVLATFCLLILSNSASSGVSIGASSSFLGCTKSLSILFNSAKAVAKALSFNSDSVNCSPLNLALIRSTSLAFSSAILIKR